MRFNEFKNLITEAQKGAQASVAQFNEPGYFTVGDSHSNGVGNYGRGKTWKALGMDGASAFDPMHPAAIAKIPSGSVVAISLGANDLGSKPIPQIVSQVNKIIGDAKERGLEVVYLLPTATTDLKKKDKRDELRKALNAGINVPTYDLGTVKGGDGLHQPMGVYGGIANRIASEHTLSNKTKLGTPDQKPGAPSVKDRIATSAELEQGPPYPSSQKDEVTTMQQSLQDLGYSVGRTGVDGKYGPFTAAAVAAFKKDYDLKGNGSAFGKESFDMLSKINAGQVAKVKIPTSVNTEKGADLDIPALTSVENVDKARKVAETFLGRTMNDDEWKHLIQTTSAESSPNSVEMAQIAAVILNRTRERYGGKSTVVGVVWAPGQFEPVTGHPIKGGGWTGPHPNFTTPVSKARLAKIVDSLLTNLPNADKSFLNFTSANPAAYKTASGRKFLDKMYASGGTKIGGTVFGTVA
jgi:hypothetical protein